MKTKKSNRKGMTLIEVLVTLAIFAIFIQVSYSIFFAGNKSFEVSKNIGFAQQDVRLATDFINSELRYINQLDNKPLEGKYFSLEINNNGDQTYSIEKKEHGEGYEEGNLLLSINGKWSKISISNFEMGKLVSTISQIEGKQEYSIDNFEVALENNRDLKSDIILSSEGEENKKIYYTFPEDTFVASGDDSGGNGNEPEPEPEPEPENNDTWDKDVAYNSGEQVIYDSRIFVAQQYSRNNEPGKVGSPWQEITDEWKPYNIYNSGDEVTHNGGSFIARSYSKNNEPGKLTTPWQEVTTEWRSFNIYNAGDEVWYTDGNKYRAKQYTQNDVPKTSNKWEKI